MKKQIKITNQPKKKDKVGFSAFTKGKIILGIILFIPFIYSSFISKSASSDFLLYLYFPILLISSLIAIGLYKIGIHIFYEKTILHSNCILASDCIGSVEGFTNLSFIFVFIIVLLYSYLLSCILIWIFNKLRKK